jgi:hypothetical protein
MRVSAHRPRRPGAKRWPLHALAVAMGFGRFAFTGMYPLMVRDGTMSVATGRSPRRPTMRAIRCALLAARIPHVSAAAGRGSLWQARWHALPRWRCQRPPRC